MRLLLDTHVWLWFTQGAQRISKKLRETLEDPKVERWISPISVWETMILAEKKRITLLPNAQAWVRKVLATGFFQEAPLNHEVSIKSRELEMSHQDPADRFLIATAWVYDLQFVTADRVLQRQSQVAIVKA